MINQLIVGCTHAVMAEAAVLAEAAGIDAARNLIALREVMPTAQCSKNSIQES